MLDSGQTRARSHCYAAESYRLTPACSASSTGSTTGGSHARAMPPNSSAGSTHSSSEPSGSPAAAAAGTGGAGPPRQYACVYCRKRKSRCDRGQPCAVCVKAGVECVPSSRAPYSSTKRPLRANRGPEPHRDGGGGGGSDSVGARADDARGEALDIVDSVDRPSFTQ